MVLALRYLATGESCQSLSYQFQVSLVAVSYNVKGCCSAINGLLQNMFIELSNSWEKWLDISSKFEQCWNYPHDVGLIDGTHLYFYNYKHTHSIIHLVIAGSDYECIYLDVGSGGRVNNSGIWNKWLMMGL